MTGGQPLDFVYTLVTILFCDHLRSNIQFQDEAPKLSTSLASVTSEISWLQSLL